MKLLVALTGASGVIYGVRLLEVLKGQKDVETHLMVSAWAKKNLAIETDYTAENIIALSDFYYNEDDLAAKVSSGSFRHDGMVIIPCSMKTMALIASGVSSNLIQRAADVTLKENRKLVLVPRETPLNTIHLENMLKLSRIGVVIMPPMPAFYSKPASLDDIVNHFIGRVLDQFNISDMGLSYRWGE
jgi:polyprenyl P-hydroxybenzoate/phenylacrylic acid decarboxylase-like protein